MCTAAALTRAATARGGLRSHALLLLPRRQLLKAPAFLRAWLGGMGVGPAPSVAEQQARSAFRGRGQRLGAS